jgi:hypothetical protein
MLTTVRKALCDVKLCVCCVWEVGNQHKFNYFRPCFPKAPMVESSAVMQPCYVIPCYH